MMQGRFSIINLFCHCRIIIAAGSPRLPDAAVPPCRLLFVLVSAELCDDERLLSVVDESLLSSLSDICVVMMASPGFVDERALASVYLWAAAAVGFWAATPVSLWAAAAVVFWAATPASLWAASTAGLWAATASGLWAATVELFAASTAAGLRLSFSMAGYKLISGRFSSCRFS